MISLPFSVLSTQNENVLPKISIQEHQKFCKSLLKLYQSYNKKVSEEKTGVNKNQFNDFSQIQKNKRREEILKWFENLKINEKIKICTIKNKWLVNLFIQLYLVHKHGNESILKPKECMLDLFRPQSIFFNENEEPHFHNKIPSFNQNSDSGFYIDYFYIQSSRDFLKNIYDKKSEKREKEKKFLDHIKLLSLEYNANTIDTLTINKDFLIDLKEFKDLLKYFSNDQYFQDWLLPIKADNLYSFVLPKWMHNNQNLTFIHILIGYIEQQILLNYEYYYYSKNMYEFSYSNLILDLYEENKKLASFVKDNYYFNNNKDDSNKKEFISLKEIARIITIYKESEDYKNKIKYLHNLHDYVYNLEFSSKNKNCILNEDFDKRIYEVLNLKSLNEGELRIINLLDNITFMKFQDIVEGKEFIFVALRKKIYENYCQKNIDDLISDDFLSGSANSKKKKNKKKKKKNKKNESNNLQINEEIEENSLNKNSNEEDKKDTNTNENINSIKENKIMIINNEENIKE